MFECCSYREDGSILSLVNGHSEGKKEKSTKGRKLPFRKQDTDKEKAKRKPKRTASVHGPSGYSLVDYRHKNLSPVNKRRHHTTTRHDSSGESSIASGMNLGGSVPFDLPGTVESADKENQLGILRASSTLMLEEIGITVSPNPPVLVDVAIQCSPGGSSFTRYHSPSSSPRSATSKAEHSKRLHSVSQLITESNPLRTQSLPSTPLKKRRSFQVTRKGHSGGAQSPPLPFMLEHSRRLYTNQALVQGSASSSCRSPGAPVEVSIR